VHLSHRPSAAFLKFPRTVSIHYSSPELEVHDPTSFKNEIRRACTYQQHPLHPSGAPPTSDAPYGSFSYCDPKSFLSGRTPSSAAAHFRNFPLLGRLGLSIDVMKLYLRAQQVAVAVTSCNGSPFTVRMRDRVAINELGRIRGIMNPNFGEYGYQRASISSSAFAKRAGTRTYAPLECSRGGAPNIEIVERPRNEKCSFLLPITFVAPNGV